MKNAKKSLTLAVSSAFALSIGVSSVHAELNPFSAKSLTNGYQIADSTTPKTKDTSSSADKMMDGDCSADMKKEMPEKTPMKSMPMGKSKDGSCSAEKMKDASCSGNKAK